MDVGVKAVLAAAALVTAVSGQSPSGDADRALVDRIVAAHVAALGGIDRVHALRSFVKHGWYHEGDVNIKTRTLQARPFYRVIGDPTNLKSIHEGYDGSAWEYYPDPGIVVRTVGAAARATRHGAAFDDPLVEPQKHGTRLAYVGRERIDGRDVVTLRATLDDGFTEDVYIDAKTSLIDGYHRVVPMHAFGAALQTRNLFDDFRPEGGVMMAHRDREVDITTGRVLDDGGIESVEINPDLPRAWFSPPQWERTPTQLMIQRIYDEREDADAVLATYAEFRASGELADANTADAVDFAGYQCLKSGHTETAVRLLTASVTDYPNSARAHFGLGRAYASAGRTAESRAEYTKALELDPNFVRARTALDALR